MRIETVTIRVGQATEKIHVEVPTHLHEAVKMVDGQDNLMKIITVHLVTAARAKKRAEIMKATRSGSTQGGHSI